MLATADNTLSGEPLGDFAMRHDADVKERAKHALTVGPTEIGSDNFAFTPPVRIVPRGTRVTWINNDDVPHLIVNPRGVFGSKVLDTGQRYTYTFTTSGRYDYFCSIHPTMTGVVEVH